MYQPHKRNFAGALVFSTVAMMAATSAQAELVASWSFNNTLAADQAGVSALTAIDPLGASGFITDTVNGVDQQVYRFAGGQSAAQQGGLAVSTAGLITGNTYSVDIVFQFESNQTTWESIFGVSNRTKDGAFYVNPANYLQVYPVSSGVTPFTFGEYHQVTLTNQGDGTVSAYLDGVLQLTATTDVLDFSTYATQNPEQLIHFFLDDAGEYANGRVARIGIFDTALSASEIGNLSYGNVPGVPEPETWAMLLAGLGVMGATARRRARV
ncbi:MAG: PEPxxWA-CTERM sorting domain-containing protein [Azoarcus sp.]|jgi:hypothetical protein|nr:PEPxxWA-CTERM sorting domain-containing protein [Azoarcus sp.]